MPDWIVLLPIIFPPIGAILLTLIASRVSTRARPWLAVLFSILEIIAISVNIAPGLHRLTISDWGLPAFSIALQMDGITQLLLLSMFVLFLSLWLVTPLRAPFDLLSIAILTTAILITAADNLITAYFAWALFDLAIFVWRLVRNVERDVAVRSAIVGQMSGLLLLAGAVLIAATYTTTGAMLVALAFWARLGLFPFHWLLADRAVETHGLWFTRGVPLIAALNLWLHWSYTHVSPPFTLIGILAGIAIIIAAFHILRADESIGTALAGIAGSIVFVPLTIAFGGTAATALALWLTLSIIFAIGLFEIALHWRAENRYSFPRWLWLAGGAALAGVPLTPAFLGRIGLYVALWENGQMLLIVILSLATSWILVSLFKLSTQIQGTETRHPSRQEYIALGIVILAFVALALLAMPISYALGSKIAQSTDAAIDLVIRTDDAPGVAVGIIATLLPLFAAYLLRNWKVRTSTHRIATTSLVRMIDLDWLARLIAEVGYQMGAAARNLSTITEENPTVWILFVGLWIAIFIATAR